MKDQLTCVIDLGGSKIAGALFGSGASQVDVIAAAAIGSTSFRKGQLHDASSASEAIKQVLSNLESAAGTTISSFSLVVSGDKFKGSVGRGFLPIYPSTRAITSEDVLRVIDHSRQAIGGHSGDQLQSIPGSFKLDGTVFYGAPLGKTGGKLEVSSFSVTGDRSEVESLELLAGGCGRKIDQFVYGPVASALGASTGEERTKTTCCIDIGATLTDYVLFSEGSIVMGGSLPFGGATVTSDIAQLLKTTWDEAERMKIGHGTSLANLVDEAETVGVLQVDQSAPRTMQRKVLAEIIESRMREMLSLVQKELAKSGLVGTSGGRVVLTGGASLLPAVADLAQQEFSGWSARVGMPTADFPPSIGLEVQSNTRLSSLVGACSLLGSDDDDEVAPASGMEEWKRRVKSFWSALNAKS